MNEVLVRYSARVLVVDPDDRLLLFHGMGLGDIPELWVPPGGGLEPGESFEDAARRELREETGLRDPVLGPCIWERSIVFAWDGRLIDSRERFFVCRVPAFELAGHINPDEIERDAVLGYRWWTAAQIAASDEAFVPRRLAHLLPPLLRSEYPDPPLVLTE